MFDDKDQAQFEYLQSIQKQMVEKRKHANLNLSVVFAVFCALGYVGSNSISLAIIFGAIPMLIRGVGNDIILRQLRNEHHRTLCMFEGDLEELKLKLDLARNLP